MVARLRDDSANYANGFAVLIVLAIIGIIAVAMLPKKTTTQTSYRFYIRLFNHIFSLLPEE